MQIFIVRYSREFSRLYNLHPWYWNSLLYGLIFYENSGTPGEFSAFSAATAIHNVPILRSTMYPSLLCGQKQYGMRSLSDTSKHDRQWESNPRPSDLESNALYTWPHVALLALVASLSLCKIQFCIQSYMYFTARETDFYS